jgi:hypothetical protein
MHDARARNVRVPADMDRRIRDLPDKYGDSYESKLLTAAAIGLEQLEQDEEILRRYRLSEIYEGSQAAGFHHAR